MKTFTKKSMISSILILTILMAVFMPITSYARTRTINAVDSNNSLNMSIDSSGILTWDSVSGATGYEVMVTQPNISSLYSENVANTAFALISSIDQHKYDSGQYTIVVKAKGVSGEESMQFYYTSNVDQLESPNNLRWDGDTAKWDAVDGASIYNVELCNFDGRVTLQSTNNTSFDFSGFSPEEGWTFRVQAKPTASGTLSAKRDSSFTESPKKGNWTRTIDSIDSNNSLNMSIDSSGILTWDSVSGATGYEVMVTRPNISSLYSENVANTAFALISSIDQHKYDSGQYTIVVKAKGVSGEESMQFYYTSNVDQLESPNNLRWDGDTAKWDAVDGASIYNVELCNFDGRVTLQSTNNTSFDFSGFSPEEGWTFRVQAKPTASGTLSAKRDSSFTESPAYEVPATTYEINLYSYDITNSEIAGGTVSITTNKGTDNGLIASLEATENTNVTIKAVASSGYEFVEWKIGGPTGTTLTTNSRYSFNATEVLYLYAIFQEASLTQITEASATITTPVGGEYPSFTATSGNPTAYTATVYAWYGPLGKMDASDVFEEGQEYTVRIHFTANAGYEFASLVDYTINGTSNYTTFDTARQRGMNFTATAPAHTHDLTLVPAVSPTCSAAGNNAYYTCSGCTKVFKDALGNVETTVVAETLLIDANAHDWGAWTVTTPATEEADGEETRECNHNASHTETQSIPKLMHTHTLTLVPAKEATCTEAGNNAYYTCSGCTKVFKDALGNVETTVVAETLPIDANAHDWNDWVETTPATVDTAGEKTRTCKHDPTHIQTDTIEKLSLEITEGGNKTYTLDSGAKVQIKCNGTLANFDKLTSNGTDVDSSNYTKESGSTILTLKNTYLDTLSEGTYKLAFVYNDGRKAETNLTIAKANTPADTTDDDTNTTTGDNTTTDTTNTTTNTTDNTSNGITTGGETKTSNSPKTGDNIVMYISIMLVSALGVAGTIKFIKKRA